MGESEYFGDHCCQCSEDLLSGTPSESRPGGRRRRQSEHTANVLYNFGSHDKIPTLHIPKITVIQVMNIRTAATSQLKISFTSGWGGNGEAGGENRRRGEKRKRLT